MTNSNTVPVPKKSRCVNPIILLHSYSYISSSCFLTQQNWLVGICHLPGSHVATITRAGPLGGTTLFFYLWFMYANDQISVICLICCLLKDWHIYVFYPIHLYDIRRQSGFITLDVRGLTKDNIHKDSLGEL
jgi:hypothetical protein